METKKKIKKGKKFVKGLIKGLVIVASSAVAGAVIRDHDLSTIKGPVKLLVGLGVVSLAGAAGDAAGEYVTKQVNEVEEIVDFGCDVYDKVKEDDEEVDSIRVVEA